MSTHWLRSWARKHAAPMARGKKSRRVRPQLTRLEDRCTPSISLTNLSVAPNPVLENGSVTLTGTIVGASVGDMTVTVNWNDGSGNDTFTVAAGSATFTRSHVYLDDDPTGSSSDPYTISAGVVDAGPTVITGPNTFGYRVYDDSYWNINLVAGGTGNTTILGSGLDDDTAAIDLGADVFRFYSTNYTGASSLFASVNGLLTFGSANGASANTALSTGPSQAAIAAFWDDLHTGASGSVLTRKIDVDANGVNDLLVVEWNDVRHQAFTAQTGTIQAILQLNTGANPGDIIINYVSSNLGDASVDFGASATVGIKNSGTFDPAQVTFNAASNFVRNRNAIRFSAQNIDTTPLVSVNPFGYQMQKNVFTTPGNPMNLITGSSGVTTIHGASIDDGSAAFNLGSDVFRFYNSNFTGNNQLYVSSNGMLSFGSSNIDYDNTSLFTGPSQAVICPFWDDLHTGSANGRVLGKFIDIDGDAVNDWLIIEWSEVRHYSTGNADNGTFQVILQLNTGLAPGDILFNYVDTNFNNTGIDSAAEATVGIKNANSPGPTNPLQLTFNSANANVADGNATRIIRTQQSLTTSLTVNNVAPTVGTLTPSTTVVNEGGSLTLDGTLVDPGTRDTHRVVFGWNDGTPDTWVDLAAGVLTFSATHTYVDDNPTNTASDPVSILVTVIDDDLGRGTGSVGITVNNVAPTVAINGAPASSPEGTPITLTAGVTDPGTGDTFSYTWAVTKNGSAFTGFTGQGTSSIVLTPDDNASYVVSLTVVDDDTGSGAATPQTIIVTNVAPTVSVGGPSSVGENTAVTLTATPSDVAPDVAAGFSYVWTVTKNGSPFTGFTGQGTASITFTDSDAPAVADSFAASVAVTDKDGDTGTGNKTVTVNNVAPTATFGSNSPQYTPATVIFTFSAQNDPSPQDQAILRYSYDFNNDGDFVDPGEILNSSSATATFSYPTFGTFVVHGRISDDDGGASNYTTTVVIRATPVAEANGPYAVDERSSITLSSAGSNDPDGTIVAFEWDYDYDGVTFQVDATGAAPTFSAANLDGPSTRTIGLRVTDNSGKQSPVDTATVTVRNTAPTVTLSGPTAVTENTSVTLTSNSVDVAADVNAGFTYVWTVTKNGASFTGFAGQGTSSITLNDTDAPAAPDVFVARVFVTDKDGASGTSNTHTLTVSNVAPTATFGNDGPKPQYSTVNFTFSPRTDPSPEDLATLRYSYDFNNDGNFTSPGDILDSSSPTAGFFYSKFGTYVVHGRIADNDGGSNEYTTTVVIDKLGNGGTIPVHLSVIGADAGGGPHVRVFNADGTEQFSYFAYAETFTGGVRVATGDVTGDGIEDIITAAGAGGGPHVKVFDGSTGAEVRSFFAFAPTFTGGLMVASGDVNRDNYDDIIVAAGPGGGSQIRVFSGRTGAVLKDFQAYSGTFSGGVNVAAGDVNGDKFAEIITGAGAGGGPHVRVIDGQTGADLFSFFAFSPTFYGGVFVAVGDLNGDGRLDIITGMGEQAGTDSRVSVFDGLNSSVMWDFVPYPVFQGGVRVAAEDLDGDGKADLLLGPGRDRSSTILGLKGTNLLQLRNFYGYDPRFLGGVYVG